MELHVLLVAAAPELRARLAAMLDEAGISSYFLDHRATLNEAIAALLEHPVDLLLVDMEARGGELADDLWRLAAIAPDVTVLPISSDAGEWRDEGRLQARLRALERLWRFRVDQRRLVHRATHDRLTGLANRWLLEEKLKDAVARARRRRVSGGLLLLDLDGFKRVNDRFGHHIGDLMLETVARRLRGAVRRSDTVARFGGDEFVILFEEVGDRAVLEGLALKIEQVVAQPVKLPVGTLVPSASVGGALFPDHGDGLAALVDHADRHLYRHKAQRRLLSA